MSPPEQFWSQLSTVFRREVKTPMAGYSRGTVVIGAIVIGLGYTNISTTAKITIAVMGLIIITAIWGFVSYCVIRCPKNLIYGEESHLAEAELEYGTETGILTAREIEAQEAEEPIVLEGSD